MDLQERIHETSHPAFEAYGSLQHGQAEAVPVLRRDGTVYVVTATHQKVSGTVAAIVI